MRDEYDLKQLRVKRRGLPAGLQASKPAKVRITIALDEDVVAHFKARAAEPGALPYQTQINRVLRANLEEGPTSERVEQVKKALIDDPAFLDQLARKLPGNAT